MQSKMYAPFLLDKLHFCMILNAYRKMPRTAPTYIGIDQMNLYLQVFYDGSRYIHHKHETQRHYFITVPTYLVYHVWKRATYLI